MTPTKISPKWKGSAQPRKQRKYRYQAGLHLRQKMMHAHLSPELRRKYGLRSIQLRKEDKVKIMRGQFRKKDGKVERIDLKRGKVFVTGLEFIRKEGTKVLAPLEPSKLMVVELDLGERKRKEKIEKKGAVQ